MGTQWEYIPKKGRRQLHSRLVRLHRVGGNRFRLRIPRNRMARRPQRSPTLRNGWTLASWGGPPRSADVMAFAYAAYDSSSAPGSRSVDGRRPRYRWHRLRNAAADANSSELATRSTGRPGTCNNSAARSRRDHVMTVAGGGTLARSHQFTSVLRWMPSADATDVTE